MFKKRWSDRDIGIYPGLNSSADNKGNRSDNKNGANISLYKVYIHKFIQNDFNDGIKFTSQDPIDTLLFKIL